MSLRKNKSKEYREAISHIQPEFWLKANRTLVRKILSEFSHEKIICPEKLGSDEYRLVIQDTIVYTFSAKKYSLDHLDIELTSISKNIDGVGVKLDALQLILELRDKLEIGDDLLPIYLDEITATLSSLSFKYASKRPTSKELAQEDFQTVEVSMDEGHPVFIANNGRVGFDSCDYLKYAPECGTPQLLVWIAVHKSKTVFSCHSNMNYHQLIEHEISSDLISSFKQIMQNNVENPDDYYWMPVHEWQWREKISTRFSHYIAEKDIVFLGVGVDEYLAQQSIRTLFNISKTDRFYVKTALSILNMGFMRGLSPYFMSATPQINEWVENLLTKDAFFEKKGFSILKEVAAIGFRDENIENVISKDTPYKKMLAALWRENPLAEIKTNQRLMTMASLLHIDANGVPLVSELIKISGLSTTDWVTSYLDSYLSPLLHAYFYYDLVFMPHGENLILVLDNNKPVSMFMKDIAEEIGIVNSQTTDVPKELSRIEFTVRDELKENYLFLDIFDCFFRFLVPILSKHEDFSEREFWLLVRRCIEDYQNQFPENKDKYAQYNFLKEGFILNCMNRLQLNNNQQMIDWGDWEKNFKFAGLIKNPLLNVE